MALHASRKALAATLAFVLLLALVLTSARPAAASQNRPSWTSGDSWTYRNDDGDVTTYLVGGRSTLTLPGGTYSVWHVNQTTTPAGGSPVYITWWIQESNLGIAKGNFTLGAFGYVEITSDPPIPQAVFPLDAQDSWSGQVTWNLVGTALNVPVPYSGQVLLESDVTVPAGTFRAATIRSPSTGNDHTEFYYSEAVGYAVRIDDYDGSGALTDRSVLTAYRYAASTAGLILLVVGVLVLLFLAVAVIALVLRRRRPAVPPPGTYPAAPGYPPRPPPPGPPPSGP